MSSSSSSSTPSWRGSMWQTSSINFPIVLEDPLVELDAIDKLKQPNRSNLRILLPTSAGDSVIALANVLPTRFDCPISLVSVDINPSQMFLSQLKLALLIAPFDSNRPISAALQALKGDGERPQYSIVHEFVHFFSNPRNAARVSPEMAKWRIKLLDWLHSTGLLNATAHEYFTGLESSAPWSAAGLYSVGIRQHGLAALDENLMRLAVHPFRSAAAPSDAHLPSIPPAEAERIRELFGPSGSLDEAKWREGWQTFAHNMAKAPIPSLDGFADRVGGRIASYLRSIAQSSNAPESTCQNWFFYSWFGIFYYLSSLNGSDSVSMEQSLLPAFLTFYTTLPDNNTNTNTPSSTPPIRNIPSRISAGLLQWDNRVENIFETLQSHLESHQSLDFIHISTILDGISEQQREDLLGLLQRSLAKDGCLLIRSGPFPMPFNQLTETSSFLASPLRQLVDKYFDIDPEFTAKWKDTERCFIYRDVLLARHKKQ